MSDSFAPLPPEKEDLNKARDVNADLNPEQLFRDLKAKELADAMIRYGDLISDYKIACLMYQKYRLPEGFSFEIDESQTTAEFMTFRMFYPLASPNEKGKIELFTCRAKTYYELNASKFSIVTITELIGDELFKKLKETVDEVRRRRETAGNKHDGRTTEQSGIGPDQ